MKRWLLALAVLATALPLSSARAADCSRSLQNLVDTARPGATVLVPACTYRETVTIAKPITLDGQRQAVIDGDNTRQRWLWIAADHVNIRGFSMRNAASPNQSGAIQNQEGIGWLTIEDNTLGATTGGEQIGITTTHDSKILRNDISQGGQMAIGTFRNTGLLIQGNHIHHNNTSGADPYWAAGGIKAIAETGLTITQNEVDHNIGPGIWCDIGCSGVTISGNNVHDQTYNPIFFEVSSNGQIFGNTISASLGDGVWGCIVASSSGSTVVHDNACVDSAPLRAQLESNRPDLPADAGHGIRLENNSLTRPTPNQATSWWQSDPNGPLVPGLNGNVDAGNVVQAAVSTLTPTVLAATSTATRTATPTATVVPAPRGIAKAYGVNWSGAEFGGSTWPGTLNRDYVYPSDLSRGVYFHGKGLPLIRLPFDWERLQHQAFGPLSTQDVAGVRSVLDVAQQSGEVVILDMHSFARYYGTPLTTADAPQFADAWHKIAAEFHDHPALYGYELMNEPHDLPDGSPGWNVLAQTATDAIREVDTSSVVLVPGYSWQNARFWRDNNESLNVNDPSGRLVYSAHLYFDADYSGGYSHTYDADGTTPTIGAERVQPFLAWLQAHNARGMLTEYGVPDNDPRWLTVLRNFLAAIDGSPQIVGGTYWSAGPWWGAYPLSVEPQNGVDRPQMAVIQRSVHHPLCEVNVRLNGVERGWQAC